jgi:hypothetical protein
VHSVLYLVLIEVLVVILPEIIIGNVYAGNLRGVHGDVTRLPLFRNGIYILLFVLVVKGLELSVSDFYLLCHFFRRKHRVSELHFAILLEVVVFDFRLRNRHRALDHRDQLPNKDLFLHKLLKISDSQVKVFADEVFVVLLSDEFPFREQRFAELSFMQEVADFIVSCMETQTLSFSNKGIFRNKLIARLGAEKLRKLRRDGLSASLLLRHLLRHAIDIGGSYVVSGNASVHTASSSVGETVKNSGNQRENHHHRDDGQESAQDDFLRLSGRLKKLNHGLQVNSRQKCRISLIIAGFPARTDSSNTETYARSEAAICGNSTRSKL